MWWIFKMYFLTIKHPFICFNWLFLSLVLILVKYCYPSVYQSDLSPFLKLGILNCSLKEDELS